MICAPADGAGEDGVLIGAYDPGQINSLVLITNDQNFFGLRFLVNRPGSVIEDKPDRYEFGPHAPDGGYASISWQTSFDKQNPIILRWARMGRNVVIGSVTAPTGVRVTMEAYLPWGESRMTFLAQPDRKTILGEQVQNTKATLRKFLLRTDRRALQANNYDEQAEMRKAIAREAPSQPGQSGRPGLFRYSSITYEITEDPSIGFIAMVGDDFETMESEAAKYLQKPTAALLDQAENKYRSQGARSGGALGQSLDAVSRLINWNRFYDPDKQAEFIAMSRSPIRLPAVDRISPIDVSPALSWDSLLAAAFGAMTDGNSAGSTIRAVLEGQLPDGRVPLRRRLIGESHDEAATLSGRSMPPIGALCVWKTYLETADLELLTWAYPRLLRWNEWWLAKRGDGKVWRDGNGDGLIEWGYDAELEVGNLGARTLPSATKTSLALSESGLEERMIPEANYNDISHTVELNSVGLNSLYALDTEILMFIARELGLKEDTEKLEIQYEKLRTYINLKLWSEEDGHYFDRRWDDRFSHHLSLENFYPLVAGVPGEERAVRMINTLLDPKKFWGAQLLPFIARDDAAFAATAPGRGAIWPVSNYLLYLGLRRYGYNDVASELARRSLALGRLSWESGGKFYEHYSSEDGRPIDDGKQRGQFGWLMVLPSIEELISPNPWTGLSAGSLTVTEEAKVERVYFAGAKVDVTLSPKKTLIKRDGGFEIEFDAPVRLLQYRKMEPAVTFIVTAKEQTQVKVKAVEGKKITVSVDDNVLGSTSPGASANFKVPGGMHKVLLLK
ncbi:MAG: hypothetical protein J2P41_04615 [Blastocatellia bacterium]|nr:hypothetical protein [Blastocatellia bacterium]